MIFYYRPLVSAVPDGGDYLLILRPEIPVTVFGPSASATYSGLVDTGSDNTIPPKSVADTLGIDLETVSGPPASVFGGHRVQLLTGQVTLQLEVDAELLRWRTEVCFFDFPELEDETVILGHAGFLDYFTATFDGMLGLLNLTANDDLPSAQSEM